ncbi:MAG: septum formation initiator family protein [Pseudomonadota bacterium]
MRSQTRPAFGAVIYFAICMALSAYFTFAAVQGDFGLFKRAEIAAEAQTLQARADDLARQIAVLENKTERLSDAFLDLDLLDEQARDVLGMIRVDEIVVQ